MTRVVGSLVMKNEMDRYLEPCLRWAQTFLDEIFIYDDKSDDGSPELALSLGCRVVARSESVPSFIENEGRFRQGAWNSMEKLMDVKSGDWIFSFDADEFMVAENGMIRESLQSSVSYAARKGNAGVVLPFPEVFEVRDGVPLVRTDGFWGKIQGPRLFAYRAGGVFRDKQMGSGSEPTYVSSSLLSSNNYGLSVLHYGYARVEDQQSKYERYSSLTEHGHNDSHIQSIISKPMVKPWTGQIPEVNV